MEQEQEEKLVQIGITILNKYWPNQAAASQLKLPVEEIICTIAKEIGVPVRYNILSDSMSPVSQKDWDLLEQRVWNMMTANNPIEAGSSEQIPLKLRLACYQNRMRPGEVWIAEEKVIEPTGYGLDPNTGVVGPYYPATPETVWKISCSMKAAFGLEMVYRWNNFHSH